MFEEIVSIEYVDDAYTCDIWNYDERCQDEEGGNFVINDIIVHNSIPEAVENRDDKNQSWQEKLNPIFLNVLKSTYGVIVYQEQLQALWQNVAGFSSPEAQEARKAIAKKWTFKLKDIEKKWLDGAGKVIGEEQAKDSWQKMVSFGRYAFNKSHGVAYTLMAFRCLWFKAHFAPEFWAAIMSDCNPKKLPRYISMARSEEWTPTKITNSGSIKDNGGLVINTLDITNLQKEFSVTGNKINQGLIGIKGIGENAADVFAGKGVYESIDEFVGEDRRSKTVLERFIKLGAFKTLKDHDNSKALWYYYQYKYCSGNTAFKRELDAKLLELDGWHEKAIKDERLRLEKEYRLLYPKRNKIPPAIAKWKPKPEISLKKIKRILQEDFTLEEKLKFQKEYIGYCIDSPMKMFRVSGKGTIQYAREMAYEGREVSIDGIIEKFEISKTKTGKDFAKMTINDGDSTVMIFIWQNELVIQDPDILQVGTGVNVPVSLDPQKGMFSVMRRQKIYKLTRR